jgi:hypothetical protein
MTLAADGGDSEGPKDSGNTGGIALLPCSRRLIFVRQRLPGWFSRNAWQIATLCVRGVEPKGAPIMRIVPLAVATALAATIGSVPASFAQPYDQNNRGDDNQSQYQSDMTGAGYKAQNEDGWHRGRGEDRDQDRDREWGARSHHRWGPSMGFMGPQNEDSWHRGRAEDRDQDRDRGDWGPRSHDRWGPGMGFMGPMGRSARGPMIQGAHFHFARGNARIDIQCPPQNDMQSCVQAAGQLLDKISSVQNSTLAKPDGGSTGTPATPKE